MLHFLGPILDLRPYVLWTPYAKQKTNKQTKQQQQQQKKLKIESWWKYMHLTASS